MLVKIFYSGLINFLFDLNDFTLASKHKSERLLVTVWVQQILFYVSSSLISSFSAASMYGVPSGVFPFLDAPCTIISVVGLW